MLDEITRSVIRESTTRQLYTAFDRLVEATSFRSAQGLGTGVSSLPNPQVAAAGKRGI